MRRSLLFSVGLMAVVGCTPKHVDPETSVNVAPANDCEHTATSFRCVTYVRNYDADTITVNIPAVPAVIGKEISIRVAGIDTAEMRGGTPCTKEAAKRAKDWVATKLNAAQRIDLVDVERGKYFRLVARVIVDGIDLSQELLRHGLAVPYDGGTKAVTDWCRIPVPMPSSP